nr:PHB depolymerase family esterase [uncultured Albidiferax sp.]
MHLRRDILATGLVTTFALAAGPVALAADGAAQVLAATAITQVFGDGQKLTAVALEYDHGIDSAALSPQTFRVAGRTITRAYANTAAATAAQGQDGRFVLLELSPQDATAALYQSVGRNVVRRAAKAAITQIGPLALAGGGTLAPRTGATITTSRVVNLVVDDFQQLEFKDPQTGDLLRYNLFVPKGYDKNQRYPLVLFMHDAGATSPITQTTLVQGLGAVAWASPQDQAKRPAFVLAPQFDAPVVNDQSEATSLLDTTVHLLHQVVDQYSIDGHRLYATGQSGGAMMSIAMNIQYPELFAASYIVAGQWDPAKVQPLAQDKLWIVVSQGDLKAYPGQNAITSRAGAAGCAGQPRRVGRTCRPGRIRCQRGPHGGRGQPGQLRGPAPGHRGARRPN